ncbi:hypothetical protein FB99_17010 [Pantoea agglomerans]|nr:hypothetical protein FB99_17010 [Pantoea agglomerans]
MLADERKLPTELASSVPEGWKVFPLLMLITDGRPTFPEQVSQAPVQ